MVIDPSTRPLITMFFLRGDVSLDDDRRANLRRPVHVRLQSCG